MRVDTHGYAGFAVGAYYDSLLAKVIVTAGSVAQAAVRARRALAELDVDGVPVNVVLLRALLDRPELVDGTLDTAFVDVHLPELVPDVVPDVAAAERAPATAPPGTEAALSTTHGVVVAIEVTEGDVVPAGAELVVLEAMKMQHVVHAGGAGRVDTVAVKVVRQASV